MSRGILFWGYRGNSRKDVPMIGRLRRDVPMYRLTAGLDQCPRPSRFFFNLEGLREGEENVTMPGRLRRDVPMYR